MVMRGRISTSVAILMTGVLAATAAAQWRVPSIGGYLLAAYAPTLRRQYPCESATESFVYCRPSDSLTLMMRNDTILEIRLSTSYRPVSRGCDPTNEWASTWKVRVTQWLGMPDSVWMVDPPTGGEPTSRILVAGWHRRRWRANFNTSTSCGFEFGRVFRRGVAILSVTDARVKEMRDP
jgi:hypothetical protein